MGKFWVPNCLLSRLNVFNRLIYETGLLFTLLTILSQYTDTEFKAGPNLNVIIGPNGSGKSTIVNGICLGLAGKPSVLGRASTMADFIKQGEQQAMVEVELFVPDGENVVIGRRWDMSNKTVWTIGGNKVNEKEVKKLVAHFR